MASHKLFGRQLSRDTEHRIALRRNLVQSLFEHGKIRTTLPKAKEVKAFAERLITEARKNTILARRRVVQQLQDRRLVDENQEFITDGPSTVVQRLFKDIAPKFVGRNGGYTRIIKLPQHRIGDGGDLVLLQLLTDEQATQTPAAGAPARSTRRSAGLRRKRNERKHQFASKAIKKTEAAAA
jgi:large subunit ribosomal protein L17